MSKRKKWVLGIAAAVILLPLLIVAAQKYYYTDARIYEETWKMNLPRTVDTVYSKNNQGALGDGYRYTIFSYDDSSFQFTHDFKSEKNPELENQITAVLKALTVEQAQYPDFSQDYVWEYRSQNAGDKLFMLYFQTAATLYVVQITM